MKAQLVNPWGEMVHLTSVPSEGRTLLRWFPRVPLAISYEGRAYGDTGLYSMGYRVYREGWRVPEIVSVGGREFFRGTSSSSQASDPAFNRAPGGQSSSEYWSFDGGDYFALDEASPSWVESAHKTASRD